MGNPDSALDRGWRIGLFRSARFFLQYGNQVASLRCTQRLLRRLKKKPDLSLDVSPKRLGDWYANLLNAGSNRLVIAVSEHSLLTVVVPIRDPAQLRERIREAVHGMLYSIGVPPAHAAQEVRGLDSMPFGKTANRSVVASMNDFMIRLKDDVWDSGGGVHAEYLQFRIGEMPCAPIGFNTPIEKTLEIFEHI